MLCSRKTLNKIRIFIVKTITLIMGIIFMLCLCAADSSNLALVFALMLISGSWLTMVAYANGWMTGTDPWYEREEREKRKSDLY